MVNVLDVDLTGKLKNYLFAWSDAIGYMSRAQEKEGSVTYLSFENSSMEYMEGGCRLKRLEGKKVKLITQDKSGKVIENNWKEIFA